MPKEPTEQTNLRLAAAIKARAKAAAEAENIDLARLVERALVAYLDSNSNVVAAANPDSSLVARVAILEAQVAELASKVEVGAVEPGQAETMPPPPPPKSAQKQPSQNRQQAASKPPQVAQHTPGEGLSIGEALLAAGAEISEAHALGSNRDQRMVTRYQMKAAPWLESQGWQMVKRKWHPPG